MGDAGMGTDQSERGPDSRHVPVLRRSPTERERIAAEIADRLDRPMAALGVIFLLVVLAQAFADDGSATATGLEVASWLLWIVFVVEFVARMVVAPSTVDFLKRNWWQLALLAVPFLRFLRVLRAARLARAGRILSSAVRSTNTARRQLAGRLAWLAAATVVAILASSQMLYEFSSYDSYARALHEATLTVVSGEPLTVDDAFADVTEIVLALYSVVVFATLAGTLGAFFVERGSERRERVAAGG